MVKFHSLAGVPVYYARVNAAYGDLSKTTSQTERGRTRRLAPVFLKRLEAAIAELYWLTYGTLGPLTAITSGGAAVPQSARRGPNDRHVRGIAFDLGGLFWKGHQDGRAEYAGLGEVLTCLAVAQDYHAGQGPDHFDGQLQAHRLYLGCEAVFRRSFGTVLGIHYNQAHWNHWHLDTGSKVGYWPTGRGANTRVTFAQLALRDIWGLYDGKIDADAGPKTRKAITALRGQLSLGPLTNPTAWSQFLLLTAMAAFNR
jgi:hypothetical protein